MARHAALQSVDLDTDARLGAHLDEDYDAGWSTSAGSAWGAAGPTIHAPPMSVYRSARLHVQWLASGWRDANHWKRAFALVKMSPELQSGLLKGLLLSSVLCASVYVFSLTMIPEEVFGSGRKDEDAVWIGSVSSAFWLYPLIAGSYFVASRFSVGVAEAAFHARNLSVANSSQTSVLDHVFRLLLIVNYSAVCFLLQLIPGAGRLLAFFAMSMVDGFFCFEQIWAARGWSMEKRLRFSESHWSYLMGFGIPSTAISFFHPSGLLNLMLFMLVFPVCTVLALLADPLPHNASVGSQSTMLPSTPTADQSKALSPLLPVRIPFFWPAVRLQRLIQRYLGPASMRKKSGIPTSAVGGVPGGAPAANTTPSSTPRRSAAQFVGGAWTGSPAAHAAPAMPEAAPMSAPAAPPVSTAINIPMGEPGALGSRKHKYG